MNPVTRAGLLTFLVRAVREGVGRRMHYVTAHTLNLAASNPDYAALLARADVVITEGFGARLGALIAGVGNPGQLPTIDWIDDFLAAISGDGSTLFLIGDEPGVAASCAQQMAQRHTGLTILGTHHGYFELNGNAGQVVVEAIGRARPDVLMVGLPNPTQEWWIDRHLGSFNANLVLPLGAMFRWYSGIETRAPRWMVRYHLEWLHRYLSHPLRHFRRYMLGNPLLVIRAIRQRTRSGRRNRKRRSHADRRS